MRETDNVMSHGHRFLLQEHVAANLEKNKQTGICILVMLVFCESHFYFLLTGNKLPQNGGQLLSVLVLLLSH